MRNDTECYILIWGENCRTNNICIEYPSGISIDMKISPLSHSTLCYLLRKQGGIFHYNEAATIFVAMNITMESSHSFYL